MAKKVPLIISSPPPDFGEVTSDAAFDDPQGRRGDLGFVPGFSEQRERRDREVAEVMRGERRSNDVFTLSHNVRWGRCQTKNGTPENTKIFGHANSGYRLCTQQDIGQPWLKELPPGASYGADGTIRQGDVVLMVTDQQHASRNMAAKQRRTRQQLEATKDAYKDSVVGGSVETEFKGKKQ